MSDPRYPIGKFSYTGPLTAEQKEQCLTDIEQTPARLRAALRGLSDQQLDTPYRDGGWTPRQVAHHVADSHMNSYLRFKLALTEDEPTIKPYMENLWAELPEAKHAPIEVSLALLDNLHQRWGAHAAGLHPRGVETNLPPSSTRPDVARKESRPLLLARTPPRSPRRDPAR
jgi:DinB superfamily